MMYRTGPRCARPQKRAKALLDLLESRGEIAECSKTIVYGSDNKRSNENYAVTGL